MQNRFRVSNSSSQNGMSLPVLLVTLALVVALVVLTLRLAPHYIDFQTLRVVMEGLPGAEIHEMDKRAIHESLEKRFKINNLRSFHARDVVAIERNKTETTLKVSYEIREPLIGNADIVLVFNEQYSYH